MIADKVVGPVLPAVDLERAKRFYREKLGLTIFKESPAGVMFVCGAGTYLFIYEHGATKADHTVAFFWVDDIRTEVSALKQKGVVFEEYDLPNLKTVDGIAKTGEYQSAWFKDTEGNILAVTQPGF
jgi:predicted enzyme related to lactoylglutathione lyase